MQLHLFPKLTSPPLLPSFPLPFPPSVTNLIAALSNANCTLFPPSNPSMCNCVYHSWHIPPSLLFCCFCLSAGVQLILMQLQHVYGSRKEMVSERRSHCVRCARLRLGVNEVSLLHVFFHSFKSPLQFEPYILAKMKGGPRAKNILKCIFSFVHFSCSRKKNRLFWSL